MLNKKFKKFINLNSNKNKNNQFICKRKIKKMMKMIY